MTLYHWWNPMPGLSGHILTLVIGCFVLGKDIEATVTLRHNAPGAHGPQEFSRAVRAAVESHLYLSILTEKFPVVYTLGLAELLVVLQDNRLL